MIVPSDALNSVNPGIEHEFAVFFYLLKDDDEKSIFLHNYVDHHRKSKEIYQSIQCLRNAASTQEWSNLTALPYVNVELTTQDDSVGPADIVLHKTDGTRLGLSVKYANKCQKNPSGRWFLSSDSVHKLHQELPKHVGNYVKEQVLEYGSADNWFRKRRTSIHTDRFIDRIRECVISDWGSMSKAERDSILNELFHMSSPISYWIIEIRKARSANRIFIDKSPIQITDSSFVSLSKAQTSFIQFSYKGKPFGKMQVKFNNGILERSTSSSNDMLVDGIPMRYGEPFGSWNFSTF